MNRRTTIAAVAILLSSTGLGYAQTPSTPRTQGRTGIKESAEDVETLRVLLTQELNARLGGGTANDSLRLQRFGGHAGKHADLKEEPKKDDDSSAEAEKPEKEEKDLPKESFELSMQPGRYLVYPNSQVVGGLFGGGNVTSYTRSFFAPGIGGWIDSSVTIPMKFVSVKSKSADDKGESDDAWERAKKSLDGDRTDNAAAAAKAAHELRAELDKDDVEKAIDAAVTILAKYGSRVRNLGDDEGVVIALKLEGGAGSFSGPGTFYGQMTAPGGRELMEYTLQDGTRIAPHTETVIVRASRALLESVKNGDIDKDAFRKRLAITRY